MITQERRTIGAATYTMLTLVLMIGMLFVGAQQAYAQMQVDNGCMEELAGSGLTCAANDVSIATATNIEILDDGCADPNDTVTFRATFTVQSTANERYDIGIYFATDGDPNGNGARSGECSINTLANSPPPWVDLDSDACGDITSAKTLRQHLSR